MFAEIDIIEYYNWCNNKAKNKQEHNINIFLKEIGTNKLLRQPKDEMSKMYILITEGMLVKYIFQNPDRDSMIVSFDNLRIS